MNDYFKYDDRQLVALLREKSPVNNEAFNVLYYRYSERLKSYCLFKTDSKEDAKELHQEAWMKFYSHVISGKNDILLPSYLYQIARTISIDKFRIKKNHLVIYQDYFDFENISDSFNLQTHIENSELLTLISLSLNQIKDKYSEAFILRYFAGLSFPEIANIIGESEDNAKKRSLRAMDEVLKILQPVISEIKN